VQVQPAPQQAPPIVSAQQQTQQVQPATEPRTQTIPTSAFKKLKDEAKERGRKEALIEFAKEQGYSSVEEMQSEIAALKTARTENASTTQDTQPSQTAQTKQASQSTQSQQPVKSNRAIMREQQKLFSEVEQLKRQLKTEVEGRKSLQREIDAKEAEMQLREVAIMNGVKDVDYALRLLSRNLEGKNDAEIEKFNEAEFFMGLKTSHPYLFGENVRPATTGTGVGNAPAALKPGEASQTQALNGQVDARKMSKEQYISHLRSKGLSVTL
jgi:hypothetical protein